jgi:hypothetical protein
MFGFYVVLKVTVALRLDAVVAGRLELFLDLSQLRRIRLRTGVPPSTKPPPLRWVAQ